MLAEVSEITGAGKGERTPEDCDNVRNGYSRLDWGTRVGTVPLNKLREGSYMRSFIEPCRTSERTLAATVQEAYVNGVTTRPWTGWSRGPMGASGVSKNQVSRLCEETDERVSAFSRQPLERNWPYLWFDATYLKSRVNRRIICHVTIFALERSTGVVRSMYRPRPWSAREAWACCCGLAC